MNPSEKTPPRWTDEQVERLLIKVFGDPAGKASAQVLTSNRSRWSHWPIVATCAALLLAIAPVLLNPPAHSTVAERTVPEEMVVADASTEAPDSTTDESPEESRDSDSSDTAEASSS